MRTNVIAIADDVAPCTEAATPRDVVHNMQLLLNIVEDQTPSNTWSILGDQTGGDHTVKL